MTLRLAGSTSGYTEIDAPAVAGSNTLVLPTGNGSSQQVLATNGSGALSWSNRPILQVVSTTKTDTFTTTSSSFVDITGLSLSITPASASNKILIFYSLQCAASAGEYSAGFQLVRNSTSICIGDANSSRSRATNGNRSTSGGSDQIWNVGTNFLDSPATTSATTYKVQGFVQSGATLYINRSPTWGDNANSLTTTSSITLMEVAP